jgi:hypothetical protein
MIPMPQRPGSELRWGIRGVRIPSSTSDTRRVAVKRHEYHLILNTIVSLLA